MVQGLGFREENFSTLIPNKVNAALDSGLLPPPPEKRLGLGKQ